MLASTEPATGIPGAFALAREHRVYVTKDGQPIGGIVSVAMMAVLEETLEDRRMAQVAGRRLKSVRSGDDDLLEADEFFAQADAIMAARQRP